MTPRVRTAVCWLWSAVTAGLVCGPLLLSRGFALTHDMVFVPHQPFKGGWLGLDGSVPRAVPSDALVSLLTQVVPGDFVQKAILLALVVLAGAGVATAAGGGLVGRLAASTLYVWNPFVYERLANGQWALLCGYAALPWVVTGARRVRDGDRRGWPALGIAMAAAAFTSPTGGVLAALVCCVLLVGRDRATAGRAVGLSVVLNLPWVVPSVLYAGGIPTDPTGVSAFAAEADTPYGVVGSLLTGGGIWNHDVTPPGRASWVLSGCLLVVAVAALAGLALRVRAAPESRRLLLLGGLGLLIAVLPTVPGGLSLMQQVDDHAPGGGLLRDSQKWVALLMLAEAVGAGAIVTELGHRLRRYGGATAWWLVAAFVVTPVAVTGSLGWGLGGRLEPVTYPRDWSAVAALVAAAQAEGRTGVVAVLPWSIYRQYAWNADRPVLDPAPRYLPGDVVIADTLVVGDRRVPGEDPRARRIGAALARGGDVTTRLRRLGVDQVVVERGTPGGGQRARLPGQPTFDGRWLQLWALGDHPAPAPALDPSLSWPARAAIVTGDVAAVGALAGCVGVVAAAGGRRYTRRRPTTPKGPT